MDIGGASSVGEVCVEDMIVDGGLNVPLGRVYACEVEADVEVDGVCSNSGSNAELHIAH